MGFCCVQATSQPAADKVLLEPSTAAAAITSLTKKKKRKKKERERKREREKERKKERKKERNKERKKRIAA